MTAPHGPWKVLASKKLVDSPWLQVFENSYELPNGAVIPTYYLTERSDSVLCACFTGSHFVMVRQYRPGIQESTLCHPGGRLEAEDSSPVSGALRELLEETGYQPVSVEPLGAFAQIPAVSAAKVHLFVVRCEASAQDRPDATEDLSVILLTPSELEAAINAGQVNCVACVALSYRALRRLNAAGEAMEP